MRRFGSNIYSSLLVALAVLRSKVVILLFIQCLLMLPLGVGFCVWSLFCAVVLRVISSLVIMSQIELDPELQCLLKVKEDLR